MRSSSLLVVLLAVLASNPPSACKCLHTTAVDAMKEADSRVFTGRILGKAGSWYAVRADRVWHGAIFPAAGWARIPTCASETSRSRRRARR